MNEYIEREMNASEYLFLRLICFKNSIPVPMSTLKWMCLSIENKLIQRHDFRRTEQQVQILECFGKEKALH